MNKIISEVREFLNNIRLWCLVKFRRSSFNSERSPLTKIGWKLILNDDFDLMNYDNWIDYASCGTRYHPGNIINNGTAPIDYYDSDCNEIKNSILKQYAKKETTRIHHIDYDGKDWGEFDIPFKVGHLNSVNTYQYGYFELRSKQPNVVSSWTAFWLSGQVTWPPEIDVYEWYGTNDKHCTSTIHWGRDGEKTRGMQPWKVKLFDLTDDFHVYGCEWMPKYIKFYIDGVLVRTFKSKKILSTWFNQKMFIIINNGIPNDLDGVIFPNIHEIDYLRIYQKE